MENGYTFIEAFRKELNEKILYIGGSLGQGGASSWEDYKTKVGVIRGYKESIDLFNDMVRRFIDEEDIE